MRNCLLAIAILVFTFSGSDDRARAGIGDPTIETDHSHYPGEGAFQTVEGVVQFATVGKQSPQEKAIALFNWLLTHQFHLASPQEPYLAGLTPDNAAMQEDLTVYDANRARFSYAYGLCGTVHAWNEPYWEALGMRARRRAFPGHVNSEVHYDGGWHAYDTDMAGLVFREDGVVAGYEDLIQNPDLVKQSQPPTACYPFAWPSDFETMRRGWQQVAEGGRWFKLYNGGYAAHPGIVHVRGGETFTRYFDPDHFGGPTTRRFWHHQKNGPFRNWTFVNQGTPQHRGDQANVRGNASYCNGVFVYQPLASRRWQDGVVAMSGHPQRIADSRQLRSSNGAPVSVTFSHFSPYVIAGDPVDDANPMSAEATDGFVIAGNAVGDVRLEFSVDQGQSWLPGKDVHAPFRLDLTDNVKGRYGWWVRLSWQDDDGIDQLRFETTTQVAQPIYPRLDEGGSQVTYRSADRAVWPVLPNFALPESNASAFEVAEMRSANIKYQPRSGDNRVVYQVTNNQPGTVVFKIDAPGPLVGVNAAARFTVRSPTPAGCDFHMDISLDDGQTWQPLGKADLPTDNEFSSGWMDGRLDMKHAGGRSALVRIHLDGGGYSTGLMDAQLYGIYQTPQPQAARIEYGWQEGEHLRTHVELIPSGTAKHAFLIPTGTDVRDQFISISAVEE